MILEIEVETKVIREEGGHSSIVISRTCSQDAEIRPAWLHWLQHMKAAIQSKPTEMNYWCAVRDNRASLRRFGWREKIRASYWVNACQVSPGYTREWEEAHVQRSTVANQRKQTAACVRPDLLLRSVVQRLSRLQRACCAVGRVQ